MLIRVEQSRVIVDPEGVTGGEIIGRSTITGETWVAARESPGRAFVDWQAPLGEPVVYRHGGVETPVASLESFRRDELSSIDGRLVAPIDRSNSREWQVERDIHEFWPKGGSRPLILRGGPNRQSEPITFGADAAASSMIERLLEEPFLVVRHNRVRCPVRNCSIPAVRLFSTRNGSVRYLGQDYNGEFNEWVLEGVEPRPPATPVPARTWADIAQEHASWADVAANHGSWAGVRDGA
ncbi:hypothetical protein EJ997_10290 [Flaviflexus ciconiae]|uniref:Uncharacterized protein n=1 Tax=Flaviflexus ciconiae TaxID=2496867 RepID=A0A3Q9G4U2_9ACTO|nr:hypothetical protein [Flaviflexus ciconiae]AZQ77672.1 hypothetical protein EJ997_10290 [Flaviflexus ciconiae]